MGTYITLQDNFIVSTVRRRLHTIFPHTGWTIIQSVLWKHMYSYVIEDHMILVAVHNGYFSAHISGMENKLRIVIFYLSPVGAKDTLYM